MLFWMNRQKFPQTHTKTHCYSCNGGTNTILMPMDLERDVIKAPGCEFSQYFCPHSVYCHCHKICVVIYGIYRGCSINPDNIIPLLHSPMLVGFIPLLLTFGIVKGDHRLTWGCSRASYSAAANHV